MVSILGKGSLIGGREGEEVAERVVSVGSFPMHTGMSEDTGETSPQGRARQRRNLMRGSASEVPGEGGRAAGGDSLCCPYPGSPHLPLRPHGPPPPPLQGHRDALSEEPEAGREALLASLSGW